MKLHNTLLAALIITGIHANAQETRDTIRPAGNTKTEGARKKMMEDLKLTKQQAKQFKEVNAEFSPKLKALRNDSTLDKKQRRKQAMDLIQQRQEKLKTFLTPEQMDKMREMQKGQMQNRRNNKGEMNDDDTP